MKFYEYVVVCFDVRVDEGGGSKVFESSLCDGLIGVIRFLF